LLIAAVLTWLTTFVLADDEAGERDLIEWSAVCGRPAGTILRARIAASVVLALVFLSVAAPAFVAAGEVSAAPFRELAADAAAMLGFACFAIGVTSAVRVTVRDRVAIWCIAMAVCLVAAVAVRRLDTEAFRDGAPALAGVILLAWAPYAVRGWRSPDVR